VRSQAALAATAAMASVEEMYKLEKAAERKLQELYEDLPENQVDEDEDD
jgi:hypothetical protein